MCAAVAAKLTGAIKGMGMDPKMALSIVETFGAAQVEAVMDTDGAAQALLQVCV